MKDIVAELNEWTHARTEIPASDLMDRAAEEISALRTALKQWDEMAMHLVMAFGACSLKAGFYEGALLGICSGADAIATAQRALSRHAEPDEEEVQVSDK